MKTWESIRTMRAVRKYAGRPLQPDEVERILHAGRRAPSAKNLQRREFIVCRDRGTLQALGSMGPYARHVAGAAMAVALVTPEPDRDSVESMMLDLGQAAQNMMLAAWDLGIGSAHAGVRDQERARTILGYPEGYRCRYLLAFGHPADPSALRPPLRSGGRLPLDQVVHEERW